MKRIGIALLGLGNVGLGTFKILNAHAKDIERRLGAQVEVRHILVRDARKERIPEARALLTTDFEKILADDETKIVVELLGGVGPKALLLKAIGKGKHVVTANKTLLALHGEELFSTALARGVDLHFEAAVCGGIPIIRTLREALASDRIESLHGIVNGTTNFILSAMADQGMPYETALRKAQELGYAEADPSADVDGHDAAQKLCLLTSLAFMARVKTEAVATQGIRALQPLDFRMGEEFGFALKLLAIAKRQENGELEVSVAPSFVSRSNPLAEVRGAFNAVLVQSAALGPSLFYGQGAGAFPTGSAVVADVVDICRNLLAGVSGRLPMLCSPHLQDVRIRPLGHRVGRYYLRFSVSDEPGVLGRIATVLGEKSVSLASVIQRQPASESGGVHASIVVFTHQTREQDVYSAVQWIDSLKSTLKPTQVIRIEADGPLGALAVE